MPEFEQIHYAVTDQIATLTLDRPDSLNAYSRTMKNELVAALELADSEDDVRAVIVTGNGEAFCAGADLSAGGSTFDYVNRGGTENEAPRDGGGEISLRIFEMRKPVIGAINGAAVGVGVTMTLPMDLRIASEDARFGFVFTRRGVVPEATSTWFLPRLVGPSRAAEWLMSGRVFAAPEALAGGLIRSVHPREELMSAAKSLALEMVNNTAPVSVALARRMMWAGLSMRTPYESHIADSRAMHATGMSADAREGIEAFLQKRRARFRGRISQDMPDVFSDLRPAWANGLPN